MKDKLNFTDAVKPTAAKSETIEVVIDPKTILSNYAVNFVSEGFRKHPLLANSMKLQASEVRDYALYLLKLRVDMVNGDHSKNRIARSLFVPAWLQYTISNIGTFEIRELGLIFTPVISVDTISDEEAMAISNRIGAFVDTLQIHQDAFPRDTKGDQDVMTTALIADYVRAVKQVSHPVATYVTAFLGLKLREENAFALLYRVQYDDVNYLQHALDAERGLF